VDTVLGEECYQKRDYDKFDTWQNMGTCHVNRFIAFKVFQRSNEDWSDY
jgi:hypothetical protein